MRLLFCGDSAGTGFGTVTRDLGAAMVARGVDVRFVSLNEQPEGVELPEPFRGRTALVGDANGWLASGVDARGAVDPDTALRTKGRLEAMCTGGLFPDGWAPEAVIVLGDVGSLQVSPVLEFIPEGFPALHYVPIEGVGLPPSWAAVWRKIRPVACSEFGADQIERLGLPRPPVVYHGVDARTFHPPTPATPYRMIGRTDTGRRPAVLRSREDCRRFLGWPLDEVILFRADRHMPRKMYPAMLRALAPVIAEDPRVRLVWHCRTVDYGGNLADERSKYPAAVQMRMNSTGFHDTAGGVPRELLPVMYAAADLYISTGAEGFGLTIAESIACGTPAVGLDYSSVPEVVGRAGVLAPVGYLVDNIYSHFWAAPDERAYRQIVRDLVADPARRGALGAAGPYQVLKFRWDRAAEQFAAILEEDRAVAA